jgi:hypothetical protein
MRISRRSLCLSASLFTLIALCILASAGCGGQQKPMAGGAKHTKKSVDCATEVDTDATSGVIANHESVYVCEGDTVTWKLGKNVTTFKVQLPTPCPFTSCSPITDTNPSATVTAQPTDHIVVYKYSISVNGGASRDPHVVGGGGA